MGAYSKMGIGPEALASISRAPKVLDGIREPLEAQAAGWIGAAKPPGCSRQRLRSGLKLESHFSGDLAALTNDFSALSPRLAASCIWRDERP